MSTLHDIESLYARQQELYAKASGGWLTEADRAALAAIRRELADLWPIRRQELASAGELPDVLRHESTFHHRPPAGDRPRTIAHSQLTLRPLMARAVGGGDDCPNQCPDDCPTHGH